MTKTKEYNIGQGQSVVVRYDRLDTTKITKILMEDFIVQTRRLRMIKKVIELTDNQEQTEEFQAEAYRRIHSILNMEFLSDCEVEEKEQK